MSGGNSHQRAMDRAAKAHVSKNQGSEVPKTADSKNQHTLEKSIQDSVLENQPKAKERTSVKNIDSALFFTIIGSIAMGLLALLQWNGVVSIPIFGSSLGYILLSLFTVIILQKWEVFKAASARTRKFVLGVASVFLLATATFGIWTQYNRDRPHPAPVTTSAAPVVVKPPLTLWQMFNQDFRGSFWSIERPYTFPDKSQLTIVSHLIFSWDDNAKFLAFYVPSSKQTYAMCLAIARDAHSAVNDIDEFFKTSQHVPGQPGTTLDEQLQFSRRVFIYAEDELSLEETANLRKAFKDKKFDLQIRSQDYRELQNYHRQDSPTTLPELKPPVNPT